MYVKRQLESQQSQGHAHTKKARFKAMVFGESNFDSAIDISSGIIMYALPFSCPQNVKGTRLDDIYFVLAQCTYRNHFVLT